MSCQPDETTSIVVKRHYKTVSLFTIFSGIDKKKFLSNLCVMDIPNESIQEFETELSL